MDTDVSEEHAATIFRVEACRVRNQLAFSGSLQARWGYSDPSDGVRKLNLVWGIKSSRQENGLSERHKLRVLSSGL
jgi:hypothetical protein